MLVKNSLLALLIVFTLSAETAEAQVINQTKKAYQKAKKAGKKAYVSYREHVGKPFEKRPRIIIGFDSRNSFISKRQVRMFGIKAGLNFDDRLRIGFTYHFKPSEILYRLNDSTVAPLQFGYLSLFGEYVWWRNSKWEISMPLYLGAGISQIKGFKETTRAWIMPVEVMGAVQYKVFCWVGFGFGFGYRHLLIGNPEINENFNAPIYVLKFRLFLGEIYNCIRPGKEECKGLLKFNF